MNQTRAVATWRMSKRTPARRAMPTRGGTAAFGLSGLRHEDVEGGKESEGDAGRQPGSGEGVPGGGNWLAMTACALEVCFEGPLWYRPDGVAWHTVAPSRRI